ncbi:MAG: hypothetical protein ABIH23_19295 [bacterium]
MLGGRIVGFVVIVMAIICVHTLINIPKDIRTIIRLFRYPPPRREFIATIIATLLFWTLTAVFIWIFARGFRI